MAGADLLNERSVTTHQSASDYRIERSDFIDSAARIESASTLDAGGAISTVWARAQERRRHPAQACATSYLAAQTLGQRAIGSRSRTRSSPARLGGCSRA